MQPEDIDKLFRDQLRDHAPAPPAYLWSQLEAELQPAKKRPAMWLYAAAAVVALLLVAGGSWLWQTPGAGTLDGTLATTTSSPTGKAARVASTTEPVKNSPASQATPSRQSPSNPTEANRADKMVAVQTPTAAETTAAPAAVRARVLPKRRMALPAEGTRQVARTTTAPAGHHSAPATATALAATTTARPERPVVPAPVRQPEPDAATLASASLVPAGTIEVEVRRGNALALADAPEATAAQPKLVGRLLRKAGAVALREARENLPRVELPVVTVNVLNHSLSTKDIQL